MAVLPNEGTTLGISDTSGGTYVSIGQLLSVTPPGGTVPEVPTTNLSSAMKTFRPGRIPEAGEVGFRVQYDPNDSQHIAMMALLTTPGMKFWKVTYVDGLATPANDTFEGFIKQADPGDAEDETNLELDITIRISGAVTRNPGSAGGG